MYTVIRIVYNRIGCIAIGQFHFSSMLNHVKPTKSLKKEWKKGHEAKLLSEIVEKHVFIIRKNL